MRKLSEIKIDVITRKGFAEDSVTDKKPMIKREAAEEKTYYIGQHAAIRQYRKGRKLKGYNYRHIMDKYSLYGLDPTAPILVVGKITEEVGELVKLAAQHGLTTQLVDVP